MKSRLKNKQLFKDDFSWRSMDGEKQRKGLKNRGGQLPGSAGQELFLRGCKLSGGGASEGTCTREQEKHPRSQKGAPGSRTLWGRRIHREHAFQERAKKQKKTKMQVFEAGGKGRNSWVEEQTSNWCGMRARGGKKENEIHRPWNKLGRSAIKIKKRKGYWPEAYS